MSDEKSSRRRKAPKNTEWRGGTLHGRARIAGKLKRWTLQTGDVELAKSRVQEDIARLKAALRGDSRIRYSDMAAAWAEKWAPHNVGPKTARRYATSLGQLENIPIVVAGTKQSRPFIDLFKDEIDPDCIRQLVDRRRAAGASTATIRRDLTALSSVLKYGRVRDNPARAELEELKERRDPIVLPEQDHIDRVTRRLTPIFAALVRSARLTGCRQDELVKAERSGLDHSRRQLTVIGKGNKRRVLDLSAEAYEELRKLPVMLGSKWLFWHKDGRPLRNVSSRFSRYVGLELKAAERAAEAQGHQEPDFRAFTFHHLRHLYAVEYLKERIGSIYDLKTQLGHRSVKTTEIYLEFLTPEEKKIAMFGTGPAPDLRPESQKESRG